MVIFGFAVIAVASVVQGALRADVRSEVAHRRVCGRGHQIGTEEAVTILRHVEDGTADHDFDIAVSRDVTDFGYRIGQAQQGLVVSNRNTDEMVVFAPRTIQQGFWLRQ